MPQEPRNTRPATVTFQDEISRLLREDPQCSKFMRLLEEVASAIASRHGQGHRLSGLDNTRVHLSREQDGKWERVEVDCPADQLTTGPLSLGERAEDLSGIELPSDLYRVFIEMYFAPDVPPAAFHTLERKARERRPAPPLPLPPPRDLWIWDERSAQPIATMTTADRKRHYSPSWIFKPAGAVLRDGIGSWRNYQALRKTCYREPVAMNHRLGMTVDPRPDTWERERALLDTLPRHPLFVRVYHHESSAQRDFRIQAIRELADRGDDVSVALVQDRAAVSDPRKWCTFLKSVLGHVADCVSYAEIGHAINRVKWGFWSFRELRAFYDACADALAGFPDLDLVGPAVIDFEYPFLLAALRAMPDRLRLAALSHLLYVDRRGAPENRQGRFAAIDKFALARAIARQAPGCSDALIITEVNWPISGTGVYSPVGAPYVSPGPRFGDPSVSEADYACYLVRYCAIALASGMVDRVYWWRLVARGFGLVDDSDPDHWRERPAFHAFRTFLDRLGESTFLQRIAVPSPGDSEAYVLEFVRTDGHHACLAWIHGAESEVDLPFTFRAADAIDGSSTPITGNRIRLTGSPVYLWME